MNNFLAVILFGLSMLLFVLGLMMHASLVVGQ